MKIGSTEISAIRIGNTTINKVIKDGALYYQAGVGMPSSPDVLFWLDGTIIDVSGTKYFQDKSSHARNFLITDYDFDSTWTSGFPYKSAATISAPVGDTALIAADINNYLYTAGTPNQIPVISLFQDVDYGHRLFCRHGAQVLDSNGVETYEPRVLDIVFYNSVKTGVDLTACQTYFGVPTEDTNAKWVDLVNGSNSNNGSKSLPWLTIAYTETQTLSAGTKIYIKSGTYTLTAQLNLTKAYNYIGVGFTKLISAQSYLIQKTTTIGSLTGLILSATTGNNTVLFDNGGGESLDRMRIEQISSFASQHMSHANPISINNIIYTGTAGSSNIYVRNSANYTISNCVSNVHDRSLIANNNESAFTGNVSVKNNKISRTALTYGRIISFTGIVRFNIDIYGNIIKLLHASQSIEAIQLANQPSVTINKNKLTTNNNSTPILITSTGADVTSVVITNNYISHKNTYGISIGTEGADAGSDKITGVVITGNKINQRADYTGTPHSILVGYNKGATIKYNYFDGNAYGIVLKSLGLDNTNGIVAYNYFYNNDFAIRCKGVLNTKIYNNTFYDITAGNYLIYIDDGGGVGTGTKIKNNIFYAVGNLNPIFVAANCTTDFECDYNIYYSENDVINFNRGGITYTFAQWQALGYDIHSQVVDPNLINNLYPTIPISGVNLESSYEDGLDIITDWGDSNNTPNVVNKKQTALWGVGAFVV